MRKLSGRGLHMRSIVGALAFALLATPAFAADENFCRTYADQAQDTAINAHDERGGLIFGEAIGGLAYFGPLDFSVPMPSNCGFSGPRWSTNYDDHFNWCRAVDEATANAEAAARTSDFQYCGVCIEYVNVALSFKRQANDLRCPLRGAGWGDESRLLRFCLAQGHSDIAATITWLQGVLNTGLRQINACARAHRTIPISHPFPKFRTPADVRRFGP
jgi:hypothetical protein